MDLEGGESWFGRRAPAFYSTYRYDIDQFCGRPKCIISRLLRLDSNLESRNNLPVMIIFHRFYWLFTPLINIKRSCYILRAYKGIPKHPPGYPILVNRDGICISKSYNRVFANATVTTVRLESDVRKRLTPVFRCSKCSSFPSLVCGIPLSFRYPLAVSLRFTNKKAWVFQDIHLLGYFER